MPTVPISYNLMLLKYTLLFIPLPFSWTLTVSFSLMRNSRDNWATLDSTGWKIMRYCTTCKLSKIVATLLFVLPGDNNDITSHPLLLFSFSHISTRKLECFFSRQRIVAAVPEQFSILRMTSSSMTPPLLSKKHFLKSYSINEKLNAGCDLIFVPLSGPDAIKSSRTFLG